MYSVEYTAHTIKDMNKLPAETKTKIFTKFLILVPLSVKYLFLN